MATKMTRGRDGRYNGSIGAGAVPPKSPETIMGNLRKQRNPVEEPRSYSRIDHEIERFEIAMQRTANPFKLITRNIERMWLERTYGAIDWKR